MTPHAPVNLLLMRHGETAWNVARRLQGSTDIALNPTGELQARALAGALATEPIDLIVSSDLQRAIQTAAAIAATRPASSAVPDLTDINWRERNYGGFEGQLIADLPALFPDHYIAWRDKQVDSPFPPHADTGSTGETIRQFHQRITLALAQLARQHAGRTVAVVAHGGVLECVWRIARQLPLHAPREVAMKNASINRFTLRLQDDQPVLDLVQWGDVRHLASTLDEIGGHGG